MTKEEIRALRSRLGLTQEQLARQLEVSWSTIARWEGGSRSPRGAALWALKRLAQDAKPDPP